MAGLTLDQQKAIALASARARAAGARMPPSVPPDPPRSGTAIFPNGSTVTAPAGLPPFVDVKRRPPVNSPVCVAAGGAQPAMIL